MAANREKKGSAPSTSNIVQTLMDRPSFMTGRLEDLPSDVADVVRYIDRRSERRAIRRQFTAEPDVSGSSVILAHFDQLRSEGHPLASQIAMGMFYGEFVKPAQADWTQDELHAYQNGPERAAQKAQSEKRANLRRHDALIQRFKD